MFFQRKGFNFKLEFNASFEGWLFEFWKIQFFPKIFFCWNFLKAGSYLILSMRHLIGPLESVNRIFAHQKCFKTTLVLTKSRLLHSLVIYLGSHVHDNQGTGCTGFWLHRLSLSSSTDPWYLISVIFDELLWQKSMN